MKNANPKLPGLPGPPAAAIAAQQEILLAIAALHRALMPLAEKLPPAADSHLTLNFKVQGDALTVSLKTQKDDQE